MNLYQKLDELISLCRIKVFIMNSKSGLIIFNKMHGIHGLINYTICIQKWRNKTVNVSILQWQ